MDSLAVTQSVNELKRKPQPAMMRLWEQSELVSHGFSPGVVLARAVMTGEIRVVSDEDGAQRTITLDGKEIVNCAKTLMPYFHQPAPNAGEDDDAKKWKLTDAELTAQIKSSLAQLLQFGNDLAKEIANDLGLGDRSQSTISG